MVPKSDYIFIMHRFDEEGRSRAKQLADILNMLNMKTVFGENLCGQRISDGVRDRLEAARLSIALLTKDTKIGTDVWQPSQWIIQEITWAAANKIPTLLLVEDGVKFDNGITGDIEKISFKNGDFAAALVRIAEQARTLMNPVIIPRELPEATPDGIDRLILEARENGQRRHWNEVLRLSDEALCLDPKAWRAMLNRGLALVNLGHVNKGKEIFLDMLEIFVLNKDALSAAYHNCGWVEEVRSAGGEDKKSLRRQIKYYEKSLKLDSSRVHTRASLLLCRALAGEKSKCNLLLTESLAYGSFLNALGFEVTNRGWQGHKALGMLPGWLYPVLFPKWEPDIEAERSKMIYNKFGKEKKNENIGVF